MTTIKNYISPEDWEDAFNHCDKNYKLFDSISKLDRDNGKWMDLNSRTRIKVNHIGKLLERYKDGERTKDLYDAMIQDFGG